MDVSQYLEIFIDESSEHLQCLSDCIMNLEKEPDQVRCKSCEKDFGFDLIMFLKI